MKWRYLVIVLLLILVVGCKKAAECGNLELEEGETFETCCIDAGCPGEQTCANNACVSPECGEDQYLDDDGLTCIDYPECEECQYLDKELIQCVDYECCADSECNDNEVCSDNECTKLNCSNCSYIEDHKCKTLVCCDDIDCDDGDSETVDLCKYPSTKSAECTYESVNECVIDDQCDDDDPSTEDYCAPGTPRKCFNLEITECDDHDNYCPAEYCNYREDNDCPDDEIECDDLACFNDALEDCLVAELTWDFMFENDTTEIETETYMQIQELDDDECKIYFKTQNVKLDFTADYIDELEDDDYSESEIEDLEDDAEDAAEEVEGNDWRCYFEDTDDLVDVLGDWEDDYDITDLEDYDCSGDYFS